MDLNAFAYGTDSPIAASGAATAPTAATAIATLAAPPVGTYDIAVWTRLGAAGPDETSALENNMELRLGAAVKANRFKSSRAPGATYFFTDVQLDGSTALTVNATASATASTLYRACILAVRNG